MLQSLEVPDLCWDSSHRTPSGNPRDKPLSKARASRGDEQGKPEPDGRSLQKRENDGAKLLQEVFGNGRGENAAAALLQERENGAIERQLVCEQAVQQHLSAQGSELRLALRVTAARMCLSATLDSETRVHDKARQEFLTFVEMVRKALYKCSSDQHKNSEVLSAFRKAAWHRLNPEGQGSAC